MVYVQVSVTCCNLTRTAIPRYDLIQTSNTENSINVCILLQRNFTPQ